MNKDFCIAYIAYVDAKVNANQMPLNSTEYAEQMNFETEIAHDITININL